MCLPSTVPIRVRHWTMCARGWDDWIVCLPQVQVVLREAGISSGSKMQRESEDRFSSGRESFQLFDASKCSRGGDWAVRDRIDRHRFIVRRLQLIRAPAAWGFASFAER